MALTVKRATKVSFGSGGSPVQKSSMVKLKIYNPGFDSEAKGQIALVTKAPIEIITSEPITFNFGTSWKNGPGASIAGKINEVMGSNMVRILGGGKIWTPVATDNWSQQVVEKGSPITCNIKFRAYYTKLGNKSDTILQNFVNANYSYVNLIKFFLATVLPPKKYSLKQGIIGGLVAAAQNVKETFSDIADAAKYEHKLDGDKTEERTDYSKAVKYTIAAAAQNTGLDEPTSGDKAVRGQYTWTIETDSFKCGMLDWILKSVNFTPSMIMYYDDGRSAPMPKYIDFDLAFETNICPSQAYISKFLIKSDNIIVNKK